MKCSAMPGSLVPNVRPSWSQPSGHLMGRERIFLSAYVLGRKAAGEEEVAEEHDGQPLLVAVECHLATHALHSSCAQHEEAMTLRQTQVQMGQR